MKTELVRRALFLGGLLFFMLFLPVLSWAQFEAIVISEINSDNQVELINTGTQTVDIGSLWLCDFPAYQTVASSTLSLDCGDTNLGPGEVLVVTDWTVDPADGELGLYTSTAFGNPNAILDYVEWGSPNHTRSSVADAAGIWNQGDFVPAFSNGQSILYDGTSDAPSAWSAGTPNLCIDNLAVPCDVEGGTLSGGPFVFCIDGQADMLADGDITLSGESGDLTAWIVTDDQGNILGLPPSPTVVDFDGAGAGLCRVWHISYQDGLTGLAQNGNIGDLDGCFDLSNGVDVIREEPDGGTVSLINGGTEFIGCAGDITFEVSHSTSAANLSYWYIITDDQDNILDFQSSANGGNLDLSGAPAGTCRVWGWSYRGLPNPVLGDNISTLNDDACEEISSNFITVYREVPDGGTVTLANGGTEFIGCAGDIVFDVTHTTTGGALSYWYIITDDQDNILAFQNSANGNTLDLSGAPAGTCRVWGWNYRGLPDPIVGDNISTLNDDFCEDISDDFITVYREVPDGGTVTLTDGSTTYTGTAGNIVFDVVHTTTGGTLSYWYIITDDQDNILAFQNSANGNTLDLSGAPAGTCRVWGWSYRGLPNPIVGDNISTLNDDFCEDISDSFITVIREEPGCQADGGELTGGPFEFTVGDGVADMIPEGAITVSNSQGENFQWIVTDDAGNILGLPPTFSVVNFDGAGAGTCEVWYLRYDGEVTGLAAGANLANLEGDCFDLSSNAVQVIRTNEGDCQANGGELFGGPFEFTVGDGIPDMIPAGSITVANSQGESFQWIVTDDAGNILGLPPTFSAVNFDGAGAGTCEVWYLRYDGEITGLAAGANLADLEGCFDLSNNAVQVIRTNEGDCQANGGELFGGPFEFTVGDGVADMIPEGAITVANSQGESFQWIVTDDAGNILGLPPTFSAVNFDGAGAGTCEVWYLRYDGEITGLAAGANLADLEGCFDLSNNAVQVIRTNEGDCQANGGELFGGPFEFTVGDGVADMIPEGAITVANSQGESFQWIVTDDAGNILGLPPTFSAVNFDGAGAGTCEVWYLRYDGEITGLAAGANLADLEGCFDLSNNAVQVIRTNEGDCQANGGELFGGPFEFTVGDGIPDMIPEGAITVANSQGESFQWIVTDGQGNILGLPPTFSVVDFDDAGVGLCQVWYLRYDGEITGLEAGQNIDNLAGCFDLSNPVDVNRVEAVDCDVEGGTLEGGTFAFCVGDGEADMIPEGSITLSGNSGMNSGWIVTDDQGNILGLPPMPSVVDFDDAGPGICLIWHISYEDGLTGLEAGTNTANLDGCFSLSNSISVTRYQPEGGTIEGGPFEFCVGDGEADMIPEGSITLSGNSGTNSGWIVTDDQGNILGLPPMPSVVDFDEAGPGICLIWHISYEDGLTGLEAGANTANLDGCFSLSNSIAVTRNQPEGGTLEGGPFTFIVGDGVADMIPEGDITLSGNSGPNTAWIVTDDLGNILGLPPTPSAVDFDGVEPGVCLIWHVSYYDLSGLEVGLNASDLEGCFSLSNSITVNREIVDATEEANPATVQLQMWPNPVQSILNVRTTFETRPEFVQYEVRTQLGQVVLQSQVGGQMLLRENLDVSQLPAGVYLLSVRTDETINTQTFVKQ